MNPSPLFKLSENSSALVGGVDSMEATFSNSCDGGLTNERTKRTKEFLTELIKHNYLGTLLRLWCRVKGGADRICHIGVGDPKVVQPVLHFGHQNWKRFIARILMRKNTCVAIHIPGFICHTCARDLIFIFFLFPFFHFQPILQPHPLQGDRRLLSRKNPKPASVVLPFLCVSLSWDCVSRFGISDLEFWYIGYFGCWSLNFGILDFWDGILDFGILGFWDGILDFEFWYFVFLGWDFGYWISLFWVVGMGFWILNFGFLGLDLGFWNLVFQFFGFFGMLAHLLQM